MAYTNIITESDTEFSGNSATGDMITLNSDITLYAQWAAIPATPEQPPESAPVGSSAGA